jgi:hypothetical protein
MTSRRCSEAIESSTAKHHKHLRKAGSTAKNVDYKENNLQLSNHAVQWVGFMLLHERCNTHVC